MNTILVAVRALMYLFIIVYYTALKTLIPTSVHQTHREFVARVINEK